MHILRSLAPCTGILQVLKTTTHLEQAPENIHFPQHFWHSDVYNQGCQSKRLSTRCSKYLMLHASCVVGVSGSLQGCGLDQVS